MALNVQMVASEVLMAAVKRVPIAGEAIDLIKAIKDRHESAVRDAKIDRIEQSLTRIELRQRDLIADEIRVTLANLARPELAPSALTDEIRNLRQIQEEGWQPNLFEGLLRNSSHLNELKRAPEHYGRLLDDHETVDLSKGAVHLLIDAGKTRILELPPFAFAQLLAHQAQGVPSAQLSIARDVWAFPGRPTAARALSLVKNSLESALVLIPAGEFEMGSEASDSMARDEEKPRHRVTITRPFFLGQTPITQREFAAFRPGHRNQFSDRPNNPAEQVNWFDAVEFCNWLSAKEGFPAYYRIDGEQVSILDRAGPGYRLPTEAEWEYACRAGTSTRFWFGDEKQRLVDHAWFADNSGRERLDSESLRKRLTHPLVYGPEIHGNGCTTHPVGQKGMNPFQLADMLGNVWEWCQDTFEANAYQRSTAVDPLFDEPREFRVIRGGSYYDDPLALRAAFRGRNPGTSGNIYFGFRVARTHQ